MFAESFLKKLFSVFLAGLLTVSLTGCFDDDDDELSATDAGHAVSAVVGSMTSVMSDASPSLAVLGSLANRDGYVAESFSGAVTFGEGVASGTVTSLEGGGTCDVTGTYTGTAYTLTLTYDDFVANGVVLDGDLSFAWTSSQSSFTGSITGDVAVDGYNVVFDVEFSVNVSITANVSITGTVGGHDVS